MKNYIIRAGDSDALVWVEAGTEPDERAQKLIAMCAKEGRSPRWLEADGHRWAWVGPSSWATRFTWEEARDIVWNKLKSNTHWFGTKRDAPIADRWCYKLVRLVPKGDTIRPKGAR
jgi:hypothetical protein